jgi:L-alanine-DL-glutamate epimerase-like enolase superfamily enzyme
VIAPLCVGRDATRIGPLMGDVQAKLAVFGRGGPFTHALSAVDIALWDIAGKAAGAGFCGVKLHERDLPVVRAGREEAGPEVALMIDVNTAWTVNQARAMAAELRGLRPKWLEEPVWPPENYDGLAEVRRTGGIAIAAGENVSTLLDFGRLLDAGAVDFVQPSPAKMGGITELRKVYPAAALRNATVMLHSFYDGPGLLAAIHATAALGTADAMIEWRYFDLEANVLGDALTVQDGRVRVPQGPGLGIDPDPGVISAYLVKD